MQKQRRPMGHPHSLEFDTVATPGPLATPCLIWRWGRSGDGYGRVWAGGPWPAHRYFFEQARGPIPPGLMPDHLCMVRLCCAPGHMEPVTNAENIRRGRVAKLTWSLVREMRAALVGGVPRLECARRFGVTPWHVDAIRAGRLWKDEGAQAGPFVTEAVSVES